VSERYDPRFANTRSATRARVSTGATSSAGFCRERTQGERDELGRRRGVMQLMHRLSGDRVAPAGIRPIDQPEWNIAAGIMTTAICGTCG
jgi:hypothetical protein